MVFTFSHKEEVKDEGFATDIYQQTCPSSFSLLIVVAHEGSILVFLFPFLFQFSYGEPWSSVSFYM
jgi:hypothetical protein